MSQKSGDEPELNVCFIKIHEVGVVVEWNTLSLFPGEMLKVKKGEFYRVNLKSKIRNMFLKTLCDICQNYLFETLIGFSSSYFSFKIVPPTLKLLEKVLFCPSTLEAYEPTFYSLKWLSLCHIKSEPSCVMAWTLAGRPKPWQWEPSVNVRPPTSALLLCGT